MKIMYFVLSEVVRPFSNDLANKLYAKAMKKSIKKQYNE